MNSKSWLLSAGLSMVMVAPVCGQLSLGPGDVTTVDSWRAFDIRFLTDQNEDGMFDSVISTAGLDMIEVMVPGLGVVQAWQFCSEFFVPPGSPSSWTITEGLGFMNSTQQQRVRALISNAFPFFNDARLDDDLPLARSYGAAMQLALWEILEESNASLILANSNPDSGIFRVDLTHPTGDPNTPPAVGFAQSFLDNISSSAWSDLGGYNYYQADPSPEQGRLWFTVEPVVIPEPSALWMAAAGALVGLRRRRRIA